MGLARSELGVTILALTIAVYPQVANGQASAQKKPTNGEEQPGASLSREIHHQLLVLPFYSVFDNIGFTVQGATVTLTGQVLRPTLKEQAEAAVRSLEGVGRVANQIEVLPPSGVDDDLRRAIYRAIYEDSTLARYAVQTVPPIHIVVKNGNVALEGMVDSNNDKTLASSRAGNVAKVLSVRNNLIVQARENARK